jgi:hypothetical protein
MTKPLVWVGTMFCGEGDFDKSKEALKKQKGVQVVHHIISHMPEREAHNALWGAWRKYRSENPDCTFVKIDADTVLRHDNVLNHIVGLFQAHARVTGIQCQLDDYFTGGFIAGLNCFSPRVTFRDTADDLFCDRNVDVDHDVVMRMGDLPESLTPAAYHCHYASPQQAFHFGVHRILKGQHHIINSTRQTWLAKKDKVRGMALLGAKYASQLGRRFNYTDAEFTALSLETASNYDRLIKEIE